jgi:hypothetical protein
MTGRFSRSWSLLKYSASVLNENRALLVFPLCSAVAAVAIVASFFPALVAIPEANDDYYALGVTGTLYLLEYFVVIFFNTALVGAVLIHMQGGKPTVADGFRIAGSHLGTIVGYALIAATVGVILRAISERVGFIGQLVVGLIGVTWTAATYLTVPVFVSRNLGPLAAVKASSGLLKKTWGENLIATGGLGLIFNFSYAAIVMLTVYGAYSGMNVSSGAVSFSVVGVGVLALVLVALVHTALAGIFSAALYSYADGDADTAQLSGPGIRLSGDRSEIQMDELFANAFHPK